MQPIPRCYTKALEAYVHTKTSTAQMFPAALFIIVQSWKQPKCLSTDK